MTPEQEIRELSGECALLLRTLDQVRRVVYDREAKTFYDQETQRLILDVVNNVYTKAPIGAGRLADAALVEDAIRRHAVKMLKLSVHKPQPGEIFPAMPYAMATWHLMRINALRAAPLDVAAAQLREEALNALDTNSKEAP